MMYPAYVIIRAGGKGLIARVYEQPFDLEPSVHEAEDAEQLIKFLKGLYELMPRVFLPEIEE